MKRLSLITMLTLSLFSCGKTKKEKAFLIFNEGVSLNLDADLAFEAGKMESAFNLNRQSVNKFRETLNINSTHTGARSALGHSLYLDKQYGEAIYWFKKSNEVYSEMATTTYREMGLCKINIGQVEEGKADLDKAFALDNTKKARENTVLDLNDIGVLAFSYGEDYMKQSELEKGNTYKKFAIQVLKLAFGYDNSKKDIALKISEFAEKTGDKETASKYQKLAAPSP